MMDVIPCTVFRTSHASRHTCAISPPGRTKEDECLVGTSHCQFCGMHDHVHVRNDCNVNIQPAILDPIRLTIQ